MTHFTKLNIASHTSVLDIRSGLEWAVNVPSLQGKLMDHEDAMEAVGKLNTEKYLGYSDWRLPTPHELFSLVGYDYGSKCYDSDAFPDMRTDDWYWTNQVTPWSTSYVFAVGFSSGLVDYYDRYNECFVRPVRVARQ